MDDHAAAAAAAAAIHHIRRSYDDGDNENDEKDDEKSPSDIESERRSGRAEEADFESCRFLDHHYHHASPSLSSSGLSYSSSSTSPILPLPLTLPLPLPKPRARIAIFIPRRIRTLLLRTAIFLLPSFVQSRYFSHHQHHQRHYHPGIDPGDESKTIDRNNTILPITAITAPSPIPTPTASSHEKEPSTPHSKSQTAYLDGLRGLAALIVFLCHLSYTSFHIAPGYGYSPSVNPTSPSNSTLPANFSSSNNTTYHYHSHNNAVTNGNNNHILKLPFIRLLYSGPPMVSLFFVISGYALSVRPLTLVHARRHSDLLAALSSLLFRRAIRLFLPCFISTFLIFILLRIGAYEWNRDFAYNERYLKNVQEIHYERFDSVSEQLLDWARNLWEFVHVWDWDEYAGSTGMDVHLWTIPVEFRASMVVFLMVLATARAKPLVRLGVVLGVVGGFAWFSARWEVVLFCVGVGLAERDASSSSSSTSPLLSSSSSSSSSSPRCSGLFSNSLSCSGPSSPGVSSSSSSFTSASPYPPTSLSNLGLPSSSPKTRKGKWRWIVTSILGMYFMSQPDQGGEETPGWVFLSSLIPAWWEDKHRFWQTIGAALFVLAVGRSSPWQRLFNSTAIQYLGKISYALYLMHGPVMHTLGYAIEKAVWDITGTEGAAYNWGFVLAAVFIIPIVVWVSDVFWRAVDAPVVRLSKWVEMRCCVV